VELSFWNQLINGISANAQTLGYCEFNAANIYSHEDRIINKARAYSLANKNQLAYMLATAYHETCKFTSFKEFGDYNYFESLYGYNIPKGVELGNTVQGDGAKYAGRGYVQLTGKSNYQSYKNITGKDLINNPDLAETDKDLASFILIDGMYRGIFTTKKNWGLCKQYIN
jgi:predicted chitinase